MKEPQQTLTVRILAERCLRIEEPEAKLTYRHVDAQVEAWQKRAAELGLPVLEYARRRLDAVRETRELAEDAEHPEFAHQLQLHRGEAVRHEEPEQPPELETPIPTPEEDVCAPW